MVDEKVLDDFIREHRLNRKEGSSVVSVNDLSQLKSAGYSAENLFDYLNKQYGSLMHGSRKEFNNPINPSKLDTFKSKKFSAEYATFCTPFGSIALLKAILSNEQSILGYTMHLIDYPLNVEIENINENTVGNRGYVYIINNIDEFVNGIRFEPFEKRRLIHPNNWIEWIKIGKEPVFYNAVVSVEKSDFIYPIFDVTNNKRIQ